VAAAPIRGATAPSPSSPPKQTATLWIALTSTLRDTALAVVLVPAKGIKDVSVRFLCGEEKVYA
jgi:hypothetical protein